MQRGLPEGFKKKKKNFISKSGILANYSLVLKSNSEDLTHLESNTTKKKLIGGSTM